MEAINSANWNTITGQINDKGYAVVPGVLTAAECGNIIGQYNSDNLYRKTIVMERYQYGLGEYKYFKYPLPALVQQLRESIYPKLAPVANDWMEKLGKHISFPSILNEQLELCHAHNQLKPTSLILKYETGGFNALHQDLYGEIFFPLQTVLFLDEPGNDYQGGEFTLVEQRSRAQSKAIVLQPCKSDMLIFTTSYRPVKGVRGYHRVNMKHGVSEVTAGRRHTLGIIFHDAV